MATYNVSNFPLLQGNEGLIEIIDFNSFDEKIKEFNQKVSKRPPFQPNFSISIRSWDLLFRGEQEDRFGNIIKWLDEFNSLHFDADKGKFEVYGFSFCLAFDTEFTRSDAPFEQFAYYRIRTILKRQNAIINDVTSTVPVTVAGDNIAYTKISYGLGYGKSIRNDDIEFVNSKNIGLLNLIDDEVIIKRSSVTALNPFNGNLPDWAKTHDGDIIFANEGNIFGKKKISSILDIKRIINSIVSIALEPDLVKHLTPVFQFFGSEYRYACDTINCPEAPGCPKNLPQ